MFTRPGKTSATSTLTALGTISFSDKEDEVTEVKTGTSHHEGQDQQMVQISGDKIFCVAEKKQSYWFFFQRYGTFVSINVVLLFLFFHETKQKHSSSLKTSGNGGNDSVTQSLITCYKFLNSLLDIVQMLICD